MSQIYENKQFEDIPSVLENTNFYRLDITYSPMGEQQGLLEFLDVVSSPGDDAIGALE